MDAEGNVVDTDYDIHSYSTGYNWGFSVAEEEYYEDYEEEDYEE